MTDSNSASARSAIYRRRWWILVILSMSLLIIGLDNTILNVAIPTLQREFDATATALQWMVDAYVLVFAGLLLTMGSLGDRFGRRRALQLGLIVFGLASFYAAYAASSAQFIGARAIMGIGGALIMPSTLSILTDVFPREERGKAIGIWAAVAGLGIGLGPVTGGILLEHFWWGSVFFVNVPIVLIALIAGILLVPESRDPHPASLDILGAVLSISAVTILVYSIIEAPVRGWTDGLVLAGLVGGAALAAAFGYWEIKTDHPMLNLAFFKNPRFSAGAGAIAIGFFALFGMIFGLTQFLQFVQGYTPLEAGLRMVPVALGMMVGAGNSHRLVGKLGTHKAVAMGLLIVAGAFVTICLVATGYRLLGRRRDLLCPRVRNGQRDGAVDRFGDGGGPRGQRRRSLRDERRHPSGGRGLRGGRDRLCYQHGVRRQDERSGGRAATGGGESRERLGGCGIPNCRKIACRGRRRTGGRGKDGIHRGSRHRGARSGGCGRNRLGASRKIHAGASPS